MACNGSRAQRIDRYGGMVAAGLMLTASSLPAQTPVISLVPLDPLPMQLASNAFAVVRYQASNLSAVTSTWMLSPITGIAQLNNGAGDCADPFTLGDNQSCVLALQLNGSQMGSGVHGGPVVCRQGNPLQCYQPSPANQLDVTIVAPPDTIFVDGFDGAP